jgi:hypothetical protein
MNFEFKKARSEKAIRRHQHSHFVNVDTEGSSAKRANISSLW